LKKFDQLKASFPDSPPYTLWAELKIADCHFLKKEYIEAIAAYEEFKKVHPTHEEILYVQYQIGQAYFNQMLTLDRDQASTKKALSSFEYLIANYPPNLFTEKAKGKIGVCKKRLADHEFYIGNFYYTHEKFRAAAQRFEGLLANFPKNPEEDKTLFLLGRSYLELDQEGKAKEAFNRIVTEYPKSFHFKEAKSILEQGVRKTKGKAAKERGEKVKAEPERVVLVRFEEEGKQPVPLKEEKKVEPKRVEEKKTLLPPLPTASESVKAVPPEEDVKRVTPPLIVETTQEDRPPATSEVTSPEGKPEEDIKTAMLPGEEHQKEIPPSGETKRETQPEEERTPLPQLPTASESVKPLPPEEDAKKVTPPSTGETMQEDRPQATSEITRSEGKPEEDIKMAMLPGEEHQKEEIPPPSPPPAAASESVKPIPPEEDVKRVTPPLTGETMQEDRSQSTSEVTTPEGKPEEDIKITIPPGEEHQKEIPPGPKPKIEIMPEEEKRVAALPAVPPAAPILKKEKPKKGGQREPETKLVDTSKPIDITSDRVETYFKENLILFKGNVMARQKDMVIYADSLEAVMTEGGKGIEKVVAGGNVKIQQGLRVANCQRAVFYNLDQKVILTGDPKVQEGENVVSGDEIVFDIDQNRFEVKGGRSGRGKARIHPEEFEKPK